MEVINEQVLHIRLLEAYREGRLPDPLREPYAPRPDAEELMDLVRHHPYLADPVPLRYDREHGLVIPAPQYLHLPPPDHLLKKGDIPGTVLHNPVKEETGGVEREFYGRIV